MEGIKVSQLSGQSGSSTQNTPSMTDYEALNQSKLANQSNSEQLFCV